jgi:hypothetical protein
MPSVFLHAEVKLLWRRQAGQLGHKLQTGYDGHKLAHPHPPYSHTHPSGVSIITPKVNIPSSFDAQLGRVSFLEKDAGAGNVLFCMLALPPCRAGQPGPSCGLFAAGVWFWWSNSKSTNVLAFAFLRANKSAAVILGNECYYVLTVKPFVHFENARKLC